jgi:hypothetical protein
LADVHARFYRMNGYNVLFPMLRNTLDMEEHTHWLMFMQGFTE